jgi:hypothetical protein
MNAPDQRPAWVSLATLGDGPELSMGAATSATGLLKTEGGEMTTAGDGLPVGGPGGPSNRLLGP